MVILTFALPDESRDLVKKLEHSRREKAGEQELLTGLIGGRRVAIFHTGMGPTRSGAALQALLSALPRDSVSALISSGFAGGLNPEWPSGTLVLAPNRSDAPLHAIARQALEGKVSEGKIESVASPLETCAEKAELAARSHASAVDMESEALAAVCAEHRLPMLSLRAISDSATEELAVPFSVCFDPVRERPRPLALIGFLLRHPSRIAPFARFIGQIGHARRRLTVSLEELVKAFPQD